ncbi:MAG: NAD(P)H-dependent oxidoreductase subunit E [Firmicutes bacterium]|nr:NAD(P)H-dependent oxidoreductase subunit E [Bacillota bacterium]
MSATCSIPFNGTPEQEKKLNTVIEKYKDVSGSLISVLHEAQEIYGYLPIEVQKMVSEGINVPLAEIYGVVSFYSQFTIKPKGKYKVAVCLGTACYVKGAGEIIDRIKTRLGIEEGDCSADGKFSLDATRCIGACGLAPVVTVNDDVYGRLVPDDIDGILDKYTD